MADEVVLELNGRTTRYDDGDGSGADDPWIRWNTAAVLLGGDIYDAHLAHLDKVNH